MPSVPFEVSDDEQLPRAVWGWLVKRRADSRCEICTRRAIEGKLRLHAHHIDGNRENNALSNGQSLCASCHSDVHRLNRGRGRARLTAA